MRSTAEQVVVEKIEDGEKEKKKKRRSGRRSKQSPSPSALGNSANQLSSEALEHMGNGKESNHVTTSLRQHKLETRPLDEHGFSNASNVAFNSMPPMHINGQANLEDMQSAQNRISHPSDPCGKMFSKSCFEPVICEGSCKGFPSQHLMEGYAQKKFFSPHWSLEAVNDALEKGDVFKALFRVNAHNRLEAYCRIEGVPTDVLVSGIAAQNRAVEGDIVAIKVDLLSLWTKMKGSMASCNNSVMVEDKNLPSECNNMAGDTCKGKAKINVDSDNTYPGSCLLPEMELNSERVTSLEEPNQSETFGPSTYDRDDGCRSSALGSSHVGSSSELNHARNAIEKMCAVISLYPSKRPTGKVLAVIERSHLRDTVIGFLNVKQWISRQEILRKDAKKNRSSLAFTDKEYIQLTPTDPKFPKMNVLVQSLPECLKERLENSDMNIEKELVAARIDIWGEESLLPLACILHTFGRGGELESQLSAILFENAICSSKFSPQSLACLPHLPWEVPLEEFQSRRDLRNLCIFTIDPSTATDLDDALSIERLPNGILRVGIHIADVSYFVLADTELDKEAQLRSTSVYMLKKKIPMLPPLLSENLGSLHAGVDRLAFSIFLDINLAGDVVDRWIGRTVINSCCKLSYEHAQEIIDGSMDTGSFIFSGNSSPQLHGYFEWLDVINSIKDLHELSKKLRERRYGSGALGLESSKVVFLFDEYGNPDDCMLSGRKASNFLVEEFMLMANMTAAEVISRAFPDGALLRRHPEPNMRKLKEFEAFCCRHGLELDTSSGQFNLSLQRIREKLKDDSTLFEILMNYASRPMQLATYFCTGEFKDNENDWGHYALAVPLYTHFTSPLRRYPDIIVHRTLAAVIDAEELYLKHQRTLNKLQEGQAVMRKCFTGINFEKDTAESWDVREALSAAALKHRVPGLEILAKVAAYCNDRNRASRHVNDACDKLYMWALLKNKQILLSEARVLGLGPRFMSIYVQKLGIERRIHYDEVEGLMVEWLEATSSLVLNLHPNRRSVRRGSPGRWRPLEDVALIVSPCNLNSDITRSFNQHADSSAGNSVNVSNSGSSEVEIDPSFFPLTAHMLSTIPVALHAIGGDNGPLDIGVRLYMSSYFW
ncbi:DIS3-like exonuclease 2 isoform X2 [Humulus lupulus]|uniref:DIS3-like exonuclease 2 isoform X2 n=1 Tax=Humulus lupulus TaxID=3486 RepID=UPI002B416582|nr:DIS3-like exonuclease 2 isoform X2 [Humulus lupulus]